MCFFSSVIAIKKNLPRHTVCSRIVQNKTNYPNPNFIKPEEKNIYLCYLVKGDSLHYMWYTLK